MPSHRIPNLSKLSAAAMAGLLSKRNRSADPGVSISFPNLPKSSVLSRAKQIDQTKPNCPPAREILNPTGGDSTGKIRNGTGTSSGTIQNPQCRGSEHADPSASKIQNAHPLSQTFQNLPESSILCSAGKFDQTKPNLSARQLAAARLVVSGVAIGEVARQIGVSRQTVGAWKRSDGFRKEVLRLHEMLARQMVGK